MSDINNLLNTNPAIPTEKPRITPYNQYMELERVPVDYKQQEANQQNTDFGSAIGETLSGFINNKIKSIKENRQLESMKPALREIFTDDELKGMMPLLKNFPKAAEQLIKGRLEQKAEEKKKEFALNSKDALELNLRRDGVESKEATAIATINAINPLLASKMMKTALEGRKIKSDYSSWLGDDEIQQQAPIEQQQVPIEQQQPMQQAPVGQESVTQEAPMVSQIQAPQETSGKDIVEPLEDTAKKEAVSENELVKAYVNKDKKEIKAEPSKKRLSFKEIAENEYPIPPKPNVKDMTLDQFKFKYNEWKDDKKEQLKNRNKRIKQLAEDDVKFRSENKEFKDEIVKKEKARREHENIFNLVERLTLQGEEGNRYKNIIINTLGNGIAGIKVDLSGNMTTAAQMIDKATSNLVKGIKDIYGARITNLDLEQFLKTIPRLMQSKEGRLAVIEMLRLENEGTEIRYDAMNEIIDENNGIEPKDLNRLVEIRSEKRLDELASKFNNIMNPLINKEESNVAKAPNIVTLRSKKTGEVKKFDRNTGKPVA